MAAIVWTPIGDRSRTAISTTNGAEGTHDVAFVEVGSDLPVISNHDETVTDPADAERVDDASASRLESDLLAILNRKACMAVRDCDLEGSRTTSPGNCVEEKFPRKVVSHIFGRNKTCTRQISDRCTILYCRKHYQRLMYVRGRNWVFTQIRIVRLQVLMMDVWGDVESWEVKLQPAARRQIAHEDARIVARANGNVDEVDRPDAPSLVADSTTKEYEERFLLPYEGRGRSSDDIDRLLTVIEEKFRSIQPQPPKFPRLQFLPRFQPTENTLGKEDQKLEKKKAKVSKVTVRPARTVEPRAAESSAVDVIAEGEGTWRSPEKSRANGRKVGGRNLANSFTNKSAGLRRFIILVELIVIEKVRGRIAASFHEFENQTFSLVGSQSS